MSLVQFISVFVIIISAFCNRISCAELDSAHAVQIISPTNNHSFELKLNDLNQILLSDDIKNRNVVVVSIAGAFRQGKSFLLNFFVKYLQAQYKQHDVTDWLGENRRNNRLQGFKWRGGRKPETNGIWMWSEIFTHDYENGEKVAIILIDTQGIFDSRSSIQDCTTIFALSTLLSSVQCFNIMQNIKEDDLQHLELFTEYGRLALEQSPEKPFNRLTFIVRDWPYAFETDYGWHGKRVIDEILDGDDHQTNDMRMLRQRIQSSFEKIEAFLMPYPGRIVAQGNEFTGDVQQIAVEFRTYVKQLVIGLFAPENLVVKTVNRQKVRAQDLIKYMEVYLNIFNSDTLPPPKSILMATAEASMQILLADSLKLYIASMQKAINDVESYIKSNELIFLHNKFENEAIAQFEAKPKLGGDRFATAFRQKIENQIQEKFQMFNETNEMKYKNFVEKANLQNQKLISELKETCGKKIVDEIGNSTASLRQSVLNDLMVTLKQTMLDEFDSRKLGDGEIAQSFREKLVHDLDHIQLALAKMCESYHDCLNHYTSLLHNSVGNSDSYLSQNDLIKLHSNAKNEAKTQFSDGIKHLDEKLAYVFQQRFENEIEQKFPAIEQSNEEKRAQFNKKADAHNEGICNELKVKFENRMLNGIGGNYLSDSTFIELFISSKVAALDEFSARKLGDDQQSNSFRINLERDLDNMQINLKQVNEKNKPPPPPPPPQDDDDDNIGLAIINGIVQVATAAISAKA